jgi:hypothetical protein
MDLKIRIRRKSYGPKRLVLRQTKQNVNMKTTSCRIKSADLKGYLVENNAYLEKRTSL